MTEKAPNLNSAAESSDNHHWDFRDVVYQGDKDVEMSEFEDDAILAEVTPYVENTRGVR